MNCQSCREHMIEFADAKLDTETAESVRAHIAACGECRSEFESFTLTLGALDAVPSNPPTHRLRAQVMGSIESEKLTLRSQAAWASSIRDAEAPRPRLRLPWIQYVLQAAGVCTLVALGFILGERTATQRQIADLRARVDTVGQLVEQSSRSDRAGTGWRRSSRPPRPASPTSASLTA